MRIRLRGHERVADNIKRVGAALERLEGGRDILRAPDFGWDDLKTERASRCLNFALSSHAAGLSALPIIANRRRPGTTSRKSSSRLPARSAA